MTVSEQQIRATARSATRFDTRHHRVFRLRALLHSALPLVDENGGGR